MSSPPPTSGGDPARGGSCPSCRKPAPIGAEYSPFCSTRCRWIDLGRWFDEAYSVPAESSIDMDGFAPLGEFAPEDPDRASDA